MSEPASQHIVLHDQFADIGQQRDTAVSGMWLFLATEVLFFGGLFAAYLVYRFQHYPAFHEFSRHLDVGMGTLNTAILLTSSFTMALAVHEAKHAEPGKTGKLVTYLVLTELFGIAFLLVKAKEWTDDYRNGFWPSHWTVSGPFQASGKLFDELYLTMVGLHGIHVLIGISLLNVFWILALRRRFSRYRYSPVEVMALYWHFVDLIWIFLYPLFYLIDPK